VHKPSHLCLKDLQKRWRPKLGKTRLDVIGKPTVNDVARVAGVSLATVDRVLNERPGVRAVTIEKVNRAIAELAYVRDTAAANLARSRTYRFAFVLPDWKGQFFASLTRSIEEVAAQAHLDRTEVRTILVPNHDHKFLVSELDALDPDEIDGLAIMSKETPVVRDAIIRLRRRGISVVTLITDQLGSERDHFVGIDNVAAGRTAAQLLGRFIGPREGSVLVLTGSMLARDHLERRLGFDEVMARDFPNLKTLASLEGRDDPDLIERLLPGALEDNRNVIGIYSSAAGNEGLLRFFRAAPSAQKPVVIAHELTPLSREALTSDLFDAVISQDSGHLVRSAVRIMRAKSDRMPINMAQERIRIDVYLKENMPP